MRIIISILLSATLLSCSNSPGEKNKKNNVHEKRVFILPDISVIDSKFPLMLGNINFRDNKNILHVNDGINSKIEQTITDYYFNECSGDSSETYFSIRETYFNTLRLQDSLQTIFIIVLRHLPDDMLNSKILFYDNLTKHFIDKTLDFNIQSLYYLDNGKLSPTKLKEKFKITAPEIEVITNNKTGMKDFKFSRIYHNGTTNAFETMLLHVTENKIDTVAFKQEWI